MLWELIIAKLHTMIVEDGPKVVNNIFTAIGICFIMYLIIKVVVNKIKVRIVGQNIETNTYTLRIAHIIGIMVFIVLMVFNLLIGLKIIGIQTGIVMGALTIAIGLGFETIIGNMIAGLILLTNEKIRVGKKFKLLGSYNELVTVVGFNIRYTVLKTLYRQKFIIPNIDLLKTPIESKRYEEKLRGKISIGLNRKHNDLEKVKKVIIDTINNHDYVIDKEKTLVIIEDFTAKGYKLTAYYYYAPLSKKLEFTINSEVSQSLKQALLDNNITIGYPNQIRRSEIQ